MASHPVAAQPAIAAWLALVAGAVNGIGVATTGRDTSHVSGVTTSVMGHLMHGRGDAAMLGIALIASFLSGAVGCGLFIAIREGQSETGTLRSLLIVEGILVASAGLALSAFGRGGDAEFAAVLLLAFAMGQQNATSSALLGDQVRTTHVTGMVTDLGREIGHLVFDVAGGAGRNGPRRTDEVRLAKSGSLFAGFILGALAGASVLLWWGEAGFFVVAAAPVAAALLVKADAGKTTDRSPR